MKYFTDAAIWGALNLLRAEQVQLQSQLRETQCTITMRISDRTQGGVKRLLGTQSRRLAVLFDGHSGAGTLQIMKSSPSRCKALKRM
jgi:hypothetical protein